MNKQILSVVFAASDSEHLNTTVDSLLRQTYKPTQVHVLFEPTNKNVASILAAYSTKSLVLCEQEELSKSILSNYAAKLKSDYIAIVTEGSVFYTDWARRNIELLSTHKAMTHVVTNSALVDNDGIVLSSSSFVTLPEWAMATYLGLGGNSPAIFYKRTRSPQEPKYIFSDDCYYAVRSTHTVANKMDSRSLEKFMGKNALDVFINGIYAHRTLGDDRENNYIALYAVTLKRLLKQLRLMSAIRMFRAGVSSAEHRAIFKQHLRSNTATAIQIAFGKTKGRSNT